MRTVEQYLEVAYALGCAFAAFVWPPLVLGVAAGFFVALAIVGDRRTPPAPPTEAV